MAVARDDTFCRGRRLVYRDYVRCCGVVAAVAVPLASFLTVLRLLVV